MSQRPLGRALAWLVFLGPFFFLSYGLANFVTEQRAHVPVLMFDWERRIPFAAWTIVPYWCSDLLYAWSLVMCRTRAELDVHAKRLFAIQVFSVACFIVFPLRCVFERPALSGLENRLFGVLLSFDRPFNQAPSLHVSLAAILWAQYRKVLRGSFRLAAGAAFFLIALSSITTYQHQFIDLPTGLWAGLLAIAALPERRTLEPQIRLTLVYLAGAIILTAGAFVIRGWGWLWLWPGFALSMVAAAYWSGDAVWLGTRSKLLRVLLLPYTAGAWINSRLWTWSQAPRNHVADSVWVGRAPFTRARDGINSVLCLAPELAVEADMEVAIIDHTVPTIEQIDAAVSAIASLSGRRPTLVCCALGYTRGAAAAAAWLCASGKAENIDDAINEVKRARPRIVIRPALRQRLVEWDQQRNGYRG